MSDLQCHLAASQHPQFLDECRNCRVNELAWALCLPARMRQCLLFRYQGYKYREIAEAQGVSVTTVKKQVSQGHKRLRPILGAYVELFGVFLALILLWWAAPVG